MIRLAGLVEEALRREGVTDPRGHYAIVQGGMVATVLASRRPFAGVLLESLERVVRDRGFELHWPLRAPVRPESTLARVLRLGPQVLRADGIDLSPPEDDKPFFFQTIDLFAKIDPRLIHGLSVNEQAVVLLRQLLAVVCVLTLVLLFLPLLYGRRMIREEGCLRGSFYFGFIGLAFMLVEIPVIQKAILYLGQPSHATTVVLASLLLGASAGASATGRVGVRPVLRWGFLAVLVLVALNLGLAGLFRATLGWSFVSRVLVTCAVTGAMGFFMGFPFPAGMMLYGERNKPWFWAVNGALSVMASVLSLALSMRFGFTAVALAGVSAYAPAWLLLAAPGPGARGSLSRRLSDASYPRRFHGNRR